MGGPGAVLLPPESVGRAQGKPRPQLGRPRVKGEPSAGPRPPGVEAAVGAQCVWTAVHPVPSRGGFLEGRVSHWLVGPASRVS